MSRLAIVLLALLAIIFAACGGVTPSTGSRNATPSKTQEPARQRPVVDRLPEDRRKQIYQEYTEAIRRSTKDTDAKFGKDAWQRGRNDAEKIELMRVHEEYAEARAQHYLGQIREKRGLTEAELTSIIFEGVEKAWPTPP